MGKQILSKRELRKKQTLLKNKELNKIKRDKKRAKKLERKLKRQEKRRNILEIKKSKKLEYQEMVKFVKERDNYTCQVCKTDHRNSDPRAIAGAHILSKENYPELKLNTNNVITLCFACHKNAKISSHLDGFAFTLWLEKNFPDRYLYLKTFLESY